MAKDAKLKWYIDNYDGSPKTTRAFMELVNLDVACYTAWRTIASLITDTWHYSRLGEELHWCWSYAEDLKRTIEVVESMGVDSNLERDIKFWLNELLEVHFDGDPLDPDGYLLSGRVYVLFKGDFFSGPIEKNKMVFFERDDAVERTLTELFMQY